MASLKLFVQLNYALNGFKYCRRRDQVCLSFFSILLIKGISNLVWHSFTGVYACVHHFSGDVSLILMFDILQK